MIGPKIQARFPQSMLIKKPVPPLPKNVWLWQLPNWCIEKTIRWVAWRSHSSGSGDEKPKKSQVSLGIRPFWCSWKKPKVVQIVNGGSVFYLWKVIFTHQKSWESFSEFLWFSQMIGGHASPYRNTPLGLKWHNFNTHKPLIVRHSPSSKGPTPPKWGIIYTLLSIKQQKTWSIGRCRILFEDGGDLILILVYWIFITSIMGILVYWYTLIFVKGSSSHLSNEKKPYLFRVYRGWNPTQLYIYI